MTRSHLAATVFATMLCGYPAVTYAQQGGTTATGQTGTTSTTQTTTTQTPTAGGQTGSMNTPDAMNGEHQFILNGALAGAFGGDNEEGSFGFDGAFDYLYNSAFGFEFLGSFTPDFDTAAINQFSAAGNTHVNAYMVNAIGAVPLGLDANWLPYVSAGIGGITLRNDFEFGTGTGTGTGTGNSLAMLNENQFGGNIGFGVMGFANQVGIRADVRYFTGIGNGDEGATFNGTNVNTEGSLNGLFGNISYWRSSVGIAFRW